MTLSDIASLVCDKVGKTDAASLALCKKFVARRYVMIHDSELWTDALLTVALSTDQPQITMPRNVDRVLAVRSGTDTNLEPNQIQQYYRTDPSIFERSGSPVAFHHLHPIGINWTGLLAAPAAVQLTFAAEDPTDTGKSITVNGDGSIGEVDETVTLDSTLVVTTTQYYTYPLSVCKDVTSGTVVYSPYEYGSSLERLEPGETKFQFARIQVTPAPTESTDYLILCKRKAPILFADSDAPLIRGSDDALVAFTQADMLERLRHYSKAAMKQQEGAAQLAKMRDLDRNQQANIPRIIPVVDCYEGYNSINTI
jgi:hypothetical protein